MNLKTEWNRLTMAILLSACLAGLFVGRVYSKDNDKTPPVDPNDPTLKFFQTADDTRGGKVTDLYLVADVYKDPAIPNEESQHILKVEYDKTKLFGKLQIVVRSVGKIHQDQMKAYTPKEFFEFGLSDQAKYMKSEAGPFGKPGDMYLMADANRPLHSVPITDEIRKKYEDFVMGYLLPAVAAKQ